jgi:hypothetical protein
MPGGSPEPGIPARNHPRVFGSEIQTAKVCVCDLKLRRRGNLCFSRKNAIFGALAASDCQDLGGLMVVGIFRSKTRFRHLPPQRAKGEIGPGSESAHSPGGWQRRIWPGTRTRTRCDGDLSCATQMLRFAQHDKCAWVPPQNVVTHLSARSRILLDSDRPPAVECSVRCPDQHSSRALRVTVRDGWAPKRDVSRLGSRLGGEDRSPITGARPVTRTTFTHHI